MNNLRRRLRSDEALLGTLISLDSPELAMILQHAGFSWFFLDLEHSALLDLKSAQRIIEVLQPRGYAVIRVPDGSETWIKHALDTGCDGIIVPHVSTPEEAERVVRSAKYPPAGGRSVGISRAQGYGARFHEYLSEATDSIAVIAQIEDVEGVKNIDAILAVDGIDAIFVGPYDLSGSLGILGELSNPALAEMVDRVRAACQAKGMPLGMFCPNPEAANTELGMRTLLLAIGSDAGHVATGAKATLDQLRRPRQ
ncbi:HpcH/HpaI aldolase family protein [Bailinhaonella thermotolerans]|uniref:2-dehydro-3-deoxyglucarate aldolase n=1 Tax=Bailinhaonella thermotolerans TaxID=1070861 RepID=A0A3A4AZQ1_9ACTN|nr:aldolase/citrate lyase family protein [Bailinhaonella thermotolerans]RJL31313.1 2-dehydro-3-deoxyglucarate aldolase [Bailinhaonella thermotolerans]